MELKDLPVNFGRARTYKGRAKKAKEAGYTPYLVNQDFYESTDSDTGEAVYGKYLHELWKKGGK